MTIYEDISTLPSYSLEELGLVDAPDEASFDNLTSLSSSIFGTPVSLLSIVQTDKDRQYFKSMQGLPEPWSGMRQTPLSHSFCKHVVASDAVLMVENSRNHDLVRDNGAVEDLNVISYLGAPVHDSNDVPIGALCVIDIEPRTWSKENSSRLVQLASCVDDLIRLRSALITTKSLQREQQEFTYAISHDLKAPTISLNVLHEEIEISLGSALTEDAQTLLNKCSQTTGRMTDMLKDVHNYASTLANAPAFSPVDLSDLLAAIISDLQPAILQSGATILLDDLPQVCGSETQIRLLFRNLLSNAIKFRNLDVAPIIKITEIDGDESGLATIGVKDNGIGIPADQCEKIYRMFTKLHVQDQYPGAGLGLTLCKRIVGNHGGKIDLKSDVGNGSHFLATLPRFSN